MAKRRRTKKAKLSPEQKKLRKIQRDHKNEIRATLAALGFSRVVSLPEREITFREAVGDLDDVFLFENVIIVSEYTTAQESGISDHLKGKRKIFGEISTHPREFVEFLDTTSSEFRRKRGTNFSTSQMRVVLVYCSLNTVALRLKRDFSNLRYFDYQVSKYFKAVTAAIKESARFEFFAFLGLAHRDIGNNSISARTSSDEGYAGSILPEEASHFPPGYKVVSFYVDPAALLARSFVLRQDRWEDKSALYQRMIDKKKIEAIRKYLLKDERVFVNNIIVTLPPTTEIRSFDDLPLRLSEVTRTQPIKIQLPAEYNSVGLIDGQHRVYSYYEGGTNESKIGRLRLRQNLLATGIVYPASASASERTKFEANLFVEINANQTNAKSDVKQTIGLLLNPYAAESIAKRVVNSLNDDGPLENQFERYFFEKGRMKTTSVVSYGIRPIVKLDSEDSLFRTWNHPKKGRLERAHDSALLGDYVDYCVEQLNTFLGAVRSSLPKERWSSNKTGGGLLTTTTINGFIVCLRKIIGSHHSTHRFPYYKKKLTSLREFDFATYKSSQYGSMGSELFKTYFARQPSPLRHHHQ